jgi:two-component system response regulator GlrR
MHRILVVDDDDSLLHLLSLRLKSAGLEVHTASSGSEALARLPLFQPHVIITDLRMEGMDGMAVFDAVHRQYPTLPVIILTAHGSIQEAVEATKRGVFTFLTKPFDSKELLAQVEKALELGGEVDTGGENGDERNHELRRDIITRSPLMEDLLRQARLVARSDASVFIQGESGTGRNYWRALFIAPVRAGRSVLSRSIAPLSRRSCSNLSYSVTSEARLPGRYVTTQGCSRPQTTVPCF